MDNNKENIEQKNINNIEVQNDLIKNMETFTGEDEI